MSVFKSSKSKKKTALPSKATAAETSLDLLKNLKLARDAFGEDKLTELLDLPEIKVAGEALLGVGAVALAGVAPWAGGIVILATALLKAKRQLGADAAKDAAAAKAEAESRKIAEALKGLEGEQLNAHYIAWVLEDLAEESELELIDNAEFSPVIQLFRTIRKGDAATIEAIQSLSNQQSQDFAAAYDKLDRLIALVEDVMRQIPQQMQLPQKILLPSLNVPSLGDLYIERQAEMVSMGDRLVWDDHEAAKGHPVKVCAYHGEPGIGKTQFAAEFAYRLHEKFTDVLYTRLPDLTGAHVDGTPRSAASADPTALNTAQASLAALYDCLPKEQRTLPEEASDLQKLPLVHEWMLEHPGWLLIFDNVDSAESRENVRALVGQLRGGSVLITSRKTHWPAGIPRLQAEEIHSAAAADYLLRRRYDQAEPPAEEAGAARELAEALHCLPLSLALAAATINEQNRSIANYLKRFNKLSYELLEPEKPGLIHHRSSTVKAIALSMQAAGDEACALLGILAFFASEPMPAALFELAEDGLEPPLPGVEDPFGAQGKLLDVGLLRLKGDLRETAIHGAIADYVRATLPEDQHQASHAAAIRWLARAMPAVASDVTHWPELKGLLPHAQEALEPLIFEETSWPAPDALALLLNQLAIFYHAQARYGEAEPLIRRALSIDEASYGPEHSDVARDLNNLAQLLQATNRLVEAEPLMRRALSIDEASYGREHPVVEIRLNNLAQLLQATNRLAEAEPLMRRALSIVEAHYGPEHPEVAIRLNNLAQLLQATNRLAEAEPLMRRALSIDEASYGPEHPGVAILLNNLAQLLQATNRLVEAEPLMRRALSIDEASYGPEHPSVARDLSNLARLLQATNRLADAEPLMRRALSIDEASYGLEHPEVATDLSNLAQLLQDTNRLAEAEPFMRRALSIDEASFGPEHPSVARDLNNLGRLLHDTSRLAEAEPLMRRMLVILLRFQLATGHEYPHLQAALNNYGGLLNEMGHTKVEAQAAINELVREVREQWQREQGEAK